MDDLSKLIDSFKDDDLSLWYHGVFNDKLTYELISLSENYLNENDLKKSRRKLSYLMAESFQNIVRHGLKPQGEENIPGIFGIRNRKKVFHIYSSNLAEDMASKIIQEKLKKVNELDGERLKSYYLEMLKNGEISEKGGAGLGLIDMAKKSGQPLQYSFENKGSYTEFNLQIDHSIEKDASPKIINIAENQYIKTILEKNRTLLLFKGNFNHESINPILNMLNENTEGIDENNPLAKKIFHIAVELLDNVTKHSYRTNEKSDSFFSLTEKNNVYYITTSNYVSNSNTKELKDHLSKINSLNNDELNSFYKEKLKKSVYKEGSGAGVGLIDVGRLTPQAMDFSFSEVDNEQLFTLTVAIS